MRIPQTPERIKEAPAQALRAVFAGVGQVLLMTERIRRRAIGQEHSHAVSAGAPATRDAPAPVQDSGGQAATLGADQTDQVKPVTAGTSATASTTKASTAKTGTAKASSPKAAATTKPSSAKADTEPATPAQADSAPPADPAPPEVRGTGVLPVPHYSELSIASLRARLRGLNITQVRDLLTYERSHEDRANVIAMFERRIAKLEESEGADPAAG